MASTSSNSKNCLLYSLILTFLQLYSRSSSAVCEWEGMNDAIDRCSGIGGYSLLGYGLGGGPGGPKKAGVLCKKNATTDFYIEVPTFCTEDGMPPGPNGPDPGGPPPKKQCGGSVISYDQQIIQESIKIVGTPYYLAYSSNKVPGYSAGNVIRIQMAPANAGYVSNMVQVDLTVDVAGNTFTHTDTTLVPKETYNLVWNGLDSSSNPVFGTTIATVTNVRTLDPSLPVEPPLVNNVNLYRYNLKKYGLGGWDLNIHHFFDPVSKTVFLGDGRSYSTEYQTVGGTNLMTASEDASELFIFDSTGKHLSTLYSIKGTTKYSFTYTGDQLDSVSDAFGNITTINHSSGNPTAIVAPFGQTTSLTVDTNGYLKDVTNPKSEKTEMTYSSNGLLYTFKKPNGVTTTLTYDSYGLLITDSSSAGNSTTIATSIPASPDYYTYANFSGTSNLGVAQNYTLQYTPYFYHREQTDAGYAKTTTEYTSTLARAVDTVYDRDKLRVTREDEYMYDKRLGLLHRTLKRRNISTEINYGATATHSQGVSLNSPGDIFSINTMGDYYGWNSKVTAVEYNGANSKYTITSPLGRVSTKTIDSYERQTQLKFANYTPVDIAYDSYGRLSSFTQGTRSWSYTYNSSGFLDTIENPKGEITSFSYDLAGRKTAMTLPDSRVVGYGYDTSGNMTSITPPGSSAQDLTYNDFDLISQYLSSNPTTYTYNNDRKVTSIVRPDSSNISFNYNSTSGRLTSIVLPTGTFSFSQNPSFAYVDAISSPDGVTQSYGHDSSFLLSQITSGATAGTLTIKYGGNFLLTSVKVDSNSAVSMSYDDDGLLVQAGDETISRDATTGKVTSRSLGNITISYTYSTSFGELSSIEAKYLTTTLYKVIYTRDDLGRIITKSETFGSSPANIYDYTYDTTGRLTNVSLAGAPLNSYAYDSNGNRTSSNYSGTIVPATFSLADKILTSGSKSFTHNLNSELEVQTDTGTMPTSVTTYGYDAFGTLKSVAFSSGTTYNYLYDGKNRRVGKKLGGTLTKQYSWLDKNRLVAEYDGSGNLISQFVYGESSNVPDYIIQGSTLYAVVSDHLGSVVAIINSTTGGITQQLSYDEFGVVIADTNPGFQPFGFAGGMYDPDTKLVKFGAREYDANIGQWLTKDPVLFDGGDTNLYRYVGNDPVNKKDVSGYCAAWVADAALKLYELIAEIEAIESVIDDLERTNKCHGNDALIAQLSKQIIDLSNSSNNWRHILDNVTDGFQKCLDIDHGGDNRGPGVI